MLQIESDHWNSKTMHRIYSKCFHNYDYEKLKEIRIFSKFISQLRYFTYSTIHYTYKVFKNLLTEYEKMPLKNKQVIKGHKLKAV